VDLPARADNMMEAIKAQDKRLQIFYQPTANPLEPRVRKLYLQGVNQKTIAKELDITLGQVKYIVRRSQWKKSPQGRR
jgi:DNA invertase Pin-like site-specific DNA recombinase